MKKFFTYIIMLIFTVSLFGCSSAPTIDRTVVPNENSAAQLTFYAFNGDSERIFGIPNLGHAFVSIKNTNEYPIVLYGYEIAGGNEVSLGTWGQSAHWGIWFNLEAHYLSIDRYKGVVSITRGVSLSELDVISAFMETSDTWTPTTNCAGFALKLWNLTAGDNLVKVKGLVTPGKLKTEFERFIDVERDRKIEVVTDAAYFDGKQYIYCSMAG